MRVLTAVPPAGGAVHEKRVETLTLPLHVPHARSLAHTFDRTYGARHPHSPLCVYGEFYARFSRFGSRPTNSSHLHLITAHRDLPSKSPFPPTHPNHNISCVYLTTCLRFMCTHTHIRVHSSAYYASLHYNFTLSGSTHTLLNFFENVLTIYRPNTLYAML